MRLHHLSLNAFGPFAGAVDLDLDRVADQGLFLIRGATGAGKTSLLDAVCFALFADIPGARSKKGLHSDHADPGTIPQVTLEFTAGGRRLLIERSPEFQRPKARGAGVTTVPPKAVLHESVLGQWQPLSTRHDEIADVVQDVLGMGLQQFSKVVLLPQGDFAAFLRASPEERRELLERLFDVSAYAGLEEWFAQRRKESAGALEAHRAALAADLGVLAEVLAGAPSEVAVAWPDWSALEPASLPAALTTATEALDAASVASLAGLDASRLADAAATATHASASHQATLRARAQQAAQRQASLLTSRTNHDLEVAALDAGARAASVQGDLKALARSIAGADQAARAAEDARSRVGRLGLDGRSADGVDLLLDRLAAGTAALDEAGVRAAALAERTRRRDQTRQRLAELTVAQARLSALAESASTLMTRLTQEREQAQQAAAALPAAVRVVENLERLHRLRSDQESSEAEAVTVATALARARDEAQDLRETYLDLREARLVGMAAELADRLSDGEPCPVCGSLEHPEVAQTSQPVSAEAVDGAEGAWRTAESTAAAYAVERAATEAARSQRADQLQDEDRTADELAHAVRAARLERDTMREAAAVLTTLDERTADALAECESLQSGLAGARDDATRTGAALATLEGDLSTEQLELERLVADHAQCPCAQGPSTGRDSRTSTLDLASLRETHDEAVAATQAYGEALRRELAATEERESVLAESQSALAAAGFADAEAARAAQLSREQLSELRRTTTDWEQELRAAQAVLDDPEVRAAVEAPEPDLASLGAARDVARSDLLRTSSQDVLLRRTVDALDRVRPGIVARCADIEATTTNHLMIRELADTLGGAGSNTLRMRLSAFVLAARLEKVVILANERLAAMGDGRYQLQHSDGLAARGARSGLGLAVLDLWTGQTRDTSSLSGGESFMASLALALGLADAVREEAGGFDLQTLFVDEGFGTLDDESLEQVMDVLDALREGGRAVGVVSHVAELRSRIPSQVVVSKTERGSSAQFAAPEGAAPAA